MSGWVQFGSNPSTDADYTVSTNPDAPAGSAQARIDGATIVVGGSIGENAILLSAVVGDPDLNQLRFQVEVRAVGTSFGDVATWSSAYVSNGQTASVVVTGLADGDYHWQCRAADINGAASPWVSFGGNPETSADFTVANAADVAPNVPAGANQYRSDGTTPIPVGATINESRVIVRATVSDPDGGMVRLRIERKNVSTAFTGSATHSSAFVPSGATATVEVTSLTGTPTGYHWQFCAEDAHGTASAWTPFDPAGGQTDTPPASDDFTVNTSLNTAPSIASSPGQFTTADLPIVPGETTVESTVRFQATILDSNGDGVRLQIEVRPVAASFFGTVTSESPLLASGTTATIDLGGLAVGAYHWQYRTVDGSGTASAWTPFGVAGDFTVVTPVVDSGGVRGGCGLIGLEPLLLLGALLLRRRRR